jgi:hypothetical protein
MPYLENSTNLYILIMMKFSFSTNLDASFPQIKQKKIGLGIAISNFGGPFASACQNQIKRLSFELQRELLRETLYYITSHLNNSIKKMKRCISICPSNVSWPSLRQLTTQDSKFGIS